MATSHALPESSRQGSKELISGAGEFNDTSFNDFLRTCVEHHKHGVVVAILGQQGSGKSTLMNHLFSTNFKEMMNPEKGKTKTTNGIWIQKALDMEKFTIVLDVEGIDGKERGQEDKVFEKQSALFAFAVADIVFINMPYSNDGCEEAANRPFLRTIFEVMLRFESPRKITLHFVLRDKSRKLSPDIFKKEFIKDVEKLWEEVPKPQGRERSHLRLLSDFFEVEVTALSNYEWALHLFQEEIVQLRERINKSTSPRSLVGESNELYFNSAKSIWNTVKQRKDLDHPPYKVMLATVRCEQIAIEKLGSFESNEVLIELQNVVNTKLANGFGTKISSILEECLLSYDADAQYYEEYVRKAKRQYLESQALKVIHPHYVKMLGHIRLEAYQKFEALLEACLSSREGFAESCRTCRESCMIHFDQQCLAHAKIEQANWDASTTSQELLQDIDKHSLIVRDGMLPPILDELRNKLSDKLSRKVRSYFTRQGNIDIWGCIRNLEKKESDQIPASLYYAFRKFGMDHATIDAMVCDLQQYARNFVVTRFKEETRDVRALLQRRFVIGLQENDSASNAYERTEANNEDVYRKCLKLLSTVAVIRLQESDDNVESVLLSSLMNVESDDIHFSPDHPLCSTTWEQVDPEMTLITPLACTEIWKVFKGDMQRLLTSLPEEVEAGWSVPDWAIVGLKLFALGGFVKLLSTWGVDAILLVELVRAGITIIGEGTPMNDVISQMNFAELGQDIITTFRRAHRDIMRAFRRWLRQLYRSIARPADNSPLLITA